MAELNPLAFKVAVQDEATGQLNKIEQQFEKLKDKTISVKVEGLSDLQNLLSALQHQQVQNLGKDVASGIHDAAKGLQEEAQKAVRASLGKLAEDLVAVKTAIQHDNFTAFSTRIEKCAQAVNTLDAAFKQFQVTIGADAGMKNFMTGLGEVIRNVRTTMGTLEVSKGGGGALSSLANTYARNVERMEDALFRLQEARAKVSNAIKGAEGAGMDNNIISRWRIYLQVLDAYEKKLQNIKHDDTLMKGRGWQTNAFGTTFKHLLSNASDFEKAANVFIRAQEKLSAAREKATGMNAGAAAQSGVSLFSGQNTEEIRKQIDAVGALYTQIQKLERELGRAGMAMQTISPTRWDELLRSGLYQKGVSYEAQMAKLRSEQIYPGDMKQQAEIIRENIERLRNLISIFKEGGYDVKGYEQQLNALLVTYEKFAALQPVDLGKKLGLEHVKGYTGPSSAATDTQWAAMKHQAEVQEVAGEAAKRHQRKLEELTNAFAQHDAQVAKSQRVQEGDNKARQESAVALRKQAQELVKARMEMLRTQSADLGKLLSMGRGTLGSEQYDAVRNALRGVREEMRQIEGVMQRMDSYSTRSLFAVGRGTTPDYTPLISSTQKLVAAKEQATQASHQMTAAEQQLAHALNQTSESARGQSQVLSDLKSLATQYLGVWGGQQFLHNIIEIGGQLEMQRLSIGAILQNTAQANELFDKIKHLATQSPFGVVQLDQMTKQLTAYGFKYNELYDMTKRLADISAATGTDVSRLALALGHVRSEAALSGYTLRQFSMANVPLLQKLSEKLGKTTKEIRDMVKKKEVGYDDVIGVLKDLTNEGGMFYNMQEVISESVKAKFKNVRDAMDIMYGEMAEGAPGDALKEVANVLMEVTKNWKDAATILGTGAAVWGIHRAAIMLYTKVLGQANYTTLAAIANSSKQVAMNNTLAWTYRSLTASEKSHTIVSQAQLRIAKLRQTVGLQLSRLQALRIAQSRREIVMGLAVALSEKKLVAEDISRQVALGKVTKAEALRAIGLSKLSAAEKAAAVQMVNNTRILGFWGKAGYAAALGIRAIGTALKSLVFNPAMMAMAAITAIMELWQRNSREMEAAEELSNKIYEHSQESLKNTRTMMESTGIHVKWREDDKSEWSDVTGSYGNQVGGQQTIQLPKFETTSAEQSIEQWSQYIRDYAATPNRILNEALFDSEGKVRSLKEQFDNLGKAVIQVAEAQRKMQSLNLGDAFGNAITETDGGWFDDNIMTDIADYDKKLKKFGANVTSVYRKYRQAVDSGIRAAERQDATFAEATKGLDTYAQKFKFLVEHQKEYINSWSAFRNVGGWDGISNQNALSEASTSSAFRTGFDEVNEAKAEMQSELNDFFLQLEGELEMRGIDKKKIQESEALQQALLLSYKDKLSSIQGLSEETANELMKLFAQWFGIKLDVDDEKFKVKVSEVQRILKELSDSEWNVDLNFASNVNDVIAEARKQYKAAKEFYENAEPVLIKFGVKMKMGDVLSEEKIKEILAKAPENARGFLEQVLRGANEASKLFNQSTTASKTGGFSLEDKKDKKKGSGGKVFRDKELETWRKRVQLLEKYRQELAQLEKIMTRQQAMSKLKADGNFAPLWGYFSDPNDFNGSLDQVARTLGTKGDRKSFVEELGAKKGAEDLRIFKENVSDAVSELGRMADVMAENYETYKKWLELTGDSDLASRIAGVAQNSSMSGWLTDKMNEELRKSGDARSASDIFSMSESDVKKFGENSAIFKLWDEWQENNKKVKKENLDLYAEAIKNAKGYAEKVADINRELEREIAAIKEMTGGEVPTEAQQSQRTALIKNATDTANKKIADETWNNFKATEEWGRIFADLDRISTGTLTRMLKKLREIAPTLNGSVESTKAVYEAIDRVTNVVNGRNPFKAISESLGNRSALSGYYKQAQQKGNLVANAELSKLLEVKLGSTVTKDQIKDGMKNESENFKKAIGKVVDGLQTFQNGLDLVSGVFDSLGMEGAANAAGDAAGVLGGAMQGASALSALGPWGMAAGAGLGLISGLSQVHDKALERQIGKLREDVQKIEANTKLIEQARERTLGFDTGDLRRSYAQDYAPNQTKEMKDLLAKYPWLRFSTFLQVYSSKAQKDMYEYYGNNSSGTGYQQEYQNLLDQRKDYLEILNKQESKKKKSQSDIEETKSKIAELDDQIRYFTQDLAKELFDIDIKGWADQLSDALSSAFENGESMAKAYKETVTSILQQVMNKMLKLAILEPMFQSLQDKLFGNAEKNISGVFDPNDPKGSMGKVTAMITDFFGKGGEGERTITAAQEFMTAFQRGVQNAGLSVLNESSNTLSSGVQGTSEETSDLLAGYVNALRQDVAIKRILLTQFVTELWPSYIEQVSQAIRALNNIDTNVAAIRALLSENGTLYLMIDSMRSHFDNITNGNEQVTIH